MAKKKIFTPPTSMLRKTAGQMHKLLGLWDKNKTSSSLPNRLVTKPTMTDGRPTFLSKYSGLSQTHVTRRQIVLNRHFTEIISDILANNLKKQLSDYGITITSIETKAWNKGVGVFYSTNNPFNKELHNELNTLISQLRAAISERRLIGRTPPVYFVYDKNAQFERSLEQAMRNISVKDEADESSLVNSLEGGLRLTEETPTSSKSHVVARHFSAPSDMSNMALGLNYGSLYDEVACKLQHSRGQSERTVSTVSLLPQKPLILPQDLESSIEDPASRILKMQNFLKSQRKKSQHDSRVRRKQALLYRDTYKWDQPPEELNTEEYNMKQ